MEATPEAAAVAAAATARGASAVLRDAGDGTVLEVTAQGISATIVLPSDESWDSLGDLPGGLPSRARGDQREKIIYNLLQDAGGLAQRQRRADSELRAKLPELISAADATSKRVIASVLADQYWIRTGMGRRASRSGGVDFPMPFHSALPAGYNYRGRYKSFRGTLFAFLSWSNGGLDQDTMERLFGFFNSDDGLTDLDVELVRCADQLIGSEHRARLDTLLELPEVKTMLVSLEAGTMYPASHERFQQDLSSVLSMPMPRHEMVASIILTFSIHVALHYYRVALGLGEGIEGVAEAVAGMAEPAGKGHFSGRLLFRVGETGDRPVRMLDPCARSFLELDEKHLLALPASIEVANLMSLVWRGAGGPDHGPVDLAGLEDAVRSDAGLGAVVDASCASLSILYGNRTGSRPPDFLSGPVSPGSGVIALREIVLDRYRTPTNRLKQRGRDVVATLVRRASGGSLIRNRGRVRFYEMDEDALFLFARWAVTRAGRPQIPLADFLDDLAAYGLRPQDVDEIENLSRVLERLGLLVRYSDAGEAQYVRIS
jgi:hypothetical protein